MSEKNNNSFESTVSSLFKGMDQFISSKTVVGDAITVGDTIILPLVDVSFGVGAGAREEGQWCRWSWRKNIPECSAGHQG